MEAKARRNPSCFAHPRIFERNIGRQAGVVGKQLANGNVLLTVGGKLGQIFCYRIIQPKAALLVKLHDRRRGRQDLGQRCDIEDGVFGHRFGRRHQGAVSVGLLKDDVAVVTGDHHRAGKFFGGDPAFNNPIDLSKLRARPPPSTAWSRPAERASRTAIFGARFLPGKILLIAHPRTNVSRDPISTNHVQAILGNRICTFPK